MPAEEEKMSLTDQILAFPLELLSRLFRFLLPPDLFRFERCCKKLTELLSINGKEGCHVWDQQTRHLELPRHPEYSEKRIMSLYFNYDCELCGRAKRTCVFWPQGVRYCYLCFFTIARGPSNRKPKQFWGATQVSGEWYFWLPAHYKTKPEPTPEERERYKVFLEDVARYEANSRRAFLPENETRLQMYLKEHNLVTIMDKELMIMVLDIKHQYRLLNTQSSASFAKKLVKWKLAQPASEEQCTTLLNPNVRGRLLVENMRRVQSHIRDSRLPLIEEHVLVTLLTAKGKSKVAMTDRSVKIFVTRLTKNTVLADNVALVQERLKEIAVPPVDDGALLAWLTAQSKYKPMTARSAKVWASNVKDNIDRFVAHERAFKTGLHRPRVPIVAAL
ncbi:hypothetical protein BCR43DRAFT_563295 [Syncephalastrum racemosum]|uniref:F-box domain-containing protein n=1 Tax=Syncephalastrum racemosum TaxID=13706 RepID=A0A1X2HG61_SYNRA|nr:hypothetical protein BCR43DRAFT_563295 [Syncephalastrum racemosum]